MRIDVHAHLWTDGYLDLLQRLGKTDTATQRRRGAGPADDEIAGRFALMDRAGVDLQILSTPPRVPHFERRDDAVAAARAANDSYAEVVRRWPTRFRTFASLPLPHVDDCLREIERALDQQRLAGVAITTSILGRSVADRTFTPIYEELNRRGAVLYVHPEGCGGRTPLIRDHHMTWMVGAPLEDTIAVAHMIVYGIPSRFPQLRIINSHLGGALPMLLQRLDNQYRWEAPDTPELPSLAARRMWYDTVAHAHAPALRAAVDGLGADRIVLGTDFPYEPGALFQRAVDYVRSAGLAPADAARILDVNAAEIFGFPPTH